MCICTKEEEYSLCCGAILSHKREAKTPEELMRSRYSAYVQGDAKYLFESTVLENQNSEDLELIEEFSSGVEWLKLDILSAVDDTVEFKAYYRDSGEIKLLHEKSNFVQESGVWKYKDGELYNTKVQRNESCPCGSGKKFKKCCDKLK